MSALTQHSRARVASSRATIASSRAAVAQQTISHAGRPDSLWRLPAFSRLWGSQMVSALGAQVGQIALPLLALALTHSPAQAGCLAAARGLPYFVLCLPAGALVDRWDARRVMLLCEIGRALAIGCIAAAWLTGHVGLPLLYAATIAEGALFVFFNQAESVCLTEIVPKERRAGAAALNEATYSLSALLGPALGGLGYGLARSLPFLGTALAYAASALALFRLPAPPPRPRAATLTARRLTDDIGEGLRWLWRHRALRLLAVLTGTLIFCTAGWTLVLIVAAQHFGASAAQIGLLTACDGVGALVGTLLPMLLRRRWTAGRILIGSAWVWALTWPIYAFAPNLATLGLTLALSSVVVPAYMATQYAYRLEQIPEALQGRVNSVFRLIAFGAAPLGLALTGILIQAVGLTGTVIVTLAPQLVLAAVATITRPLREA